MKLMIVCIYISLLFYEPVSANGNKTLEQTLLDEKIYSSFRLMYLHLSYISQYMSKRSAGIMRENLKYLKTNQKIMHISENICKITGLDVEKELPYRTSSLDLKPDTLPMDLEPYKDLPKVEKSIKEVLEHILKLFQIWEENFGYGIFSLDNDNNKQKNTNIYRLLYNDFMLIFFDITKAIYDAYEIKYNKVKPQEVYAKEIYVDGLKSFVILEGYTGLGGEPGLVQLAKRTNDADVDLINRMLSDITTQLKENPPQIETLVKIFEQYKATFQAMN